MVCCSIANCGNASSTCNYENQKITFHRFPQDKDVKDKWISATGKKNWLPSNYSRICSDHFNHDDFISSYKRRILDKSAIPTLNVWKLITGNPADRIFAPKCEPAEPSVTSTPSLKHTLQASQSTDIPQPATVDVDFDSPQKKKVKLSEFHGKDRTIVEQRLKIKSLQCKVRRYRKTIHILKNVIRNLEIL